MHRWKNAAPGPSRCGAVCRSNRPAIWAGSIRKRSPKCVPKRGRWCAMPTNCTTPCTACACCATTKHRNGRRISTNWSATGRALRVDAAPLNASQHRLADRMISSLRHATLLDRRRTLAAGEIALSARPPPSRKSNCPTRCGRIGNRPKQSSRWCAAECKTSGPITAEQLGEKLVARTEPSVRRAGSGRSRRHGDARTIHAGVSAMATTSGRTVKPATDAVLHNGQPATDNGQLVGIRRPSLLVLDRRMVRAPPAGPHSSPHAGRLAAANSTGRTARFHSLPGALASFDARHPVAWPRRLAQSACAVAGLRNGRRPCGNGACLPSRCDEYEPRWLDELSMSGELAWGRLCPPRKDADDAPSGAGLTRAAPISLLLRENLGWLLPQRSRIGRSALPRRRRRGAGSTATTRCAVSARNDVAHRLAAVATRRSTARIGGPRTGHRRCIYRRANDFRHRHRSTPCRKTPPASAVAPRIHRFAHRAAGRCFPAFVPKVDEEQAVDELGLATVAALGRCVSRSAGARIGRAAVGAIGAGVSSLGSARRNSRRPVRPRRGRRAIRTARSGRATPRHARRTI